MAIVDGRGLLHPRSDGKHRGNSNHSVANRKIRDLWLWDSYVLDKPEERLLTTRQARERVNQTRFLAALAETGSIGAAAADAGMTVSGVANWDAKADSGDWKKRKAEALESFLGRVEREINRRGIDGIDKPIFWRGEKVATVKEYSDNLLMFRTKRLDPSYKDNYQVPASAPVAATQINIHLHPDARPDAAPSIIDATDPDAE